MVFMLIDVEALISTRSCSANVRLFTGFEISLGLATPYFRLIIQAAEIDPEDYQPLPSRAPCKNVPRLRGTYWHRDFLRP